MRQHWKDRTASIVGRVVIHGRSRRAATQRDPVRVGDKWLGEYFPSLSAVHGASHSIKTKTARTNVP